MAQPSDGNRRRHVSLLSIVSFATPPPHRSACCCFSSSLRQPHRRHLNRSLLYSAMRRRAAMFWTAATALFLSRLLYGGERALLIASCNELMAFSCFGCRRWGIEHNPSSHRNGAGQGSEQSQWIEGVIRRLTLTVSLVSDLMFLSSALYLLSNEFAMLYTDQHTSTSGRDVAMLCVSLFVSLC